MELFQKICANVAAEGTWSDEGLHTTNLHGLDLEAQGLENFPEWQEKLKVELEQVGWEKEMVRDLQAALGNDSSIHNRHEDKL